MKLLWFFGAAFLLSAMGMVTDPLAANPQAATQQLRDGQHDFDFELGRWNIHLKRRLHPLTGSAVWVEFDGTSVTRKVWEGRSQLEEFETGCRALERALALEPANVDALNGYGVVLAARDQIEDATRQFRKALQLDPQRAETLFNLGSALREDENFAEEKQRGQVRFFFKHSSVY